MFLVYIQAIYVCGGGVGEDLHVLSLFTCSQLCVTLWTIACQTPLSMVFSRQKYWSGFLCPPPWDLHNLGIEPESFMSPALAGRFFTTSTT